jgi:hypothetical protein
MFRNFGRSIKGVNDRLQVLTDRDVVLADGIGQQRVWELA